MVALSALLFTFCVFATLQESICTENQDIQNLLANAETELVFPEDKKKVVLVLGNAGAGKSTFIKWIAGDDSKLISQRINPECDTCDNYKIINSDGDADSFSLIPHLEVDEETNTQYYNIAGFTDTQDIKHEISIRYFTKRIIDNADKIKFLLVMKYPSSNTKAVREDFMNLLKHFFNLVNDTYIYSIGLVVTNVTDNKNNIQNYYKLDTDRNVKSYSDDSVNSKIALFLQDVVQELKEKDKSQSTETDKIFIKKATQVVKSFIWRNITIFWQPNQAGPLSEISLMRQSKQHARHVVSESIEYVSKDSIDIKFTLSDEIKNQLHSLAEQMTKSLEDNVKLVVQELGKHYNDVANQIQFEIQHGHSIKVKPLLKKLNEGRHEIHLLMIIFMREIEEQRPQDILATIEYTLSETNVFVSQRLLSDIAFEIHFLDFLEKTSLIKINLDFVALKNEAYYVWHKMNENYNNLLKKETKINSAIKNYRVTRQVQAENNSKEEKKGGFNLNLFSHNQKSKDCTVTLPFSLGCFFLN